ncbi:MAG: hypothetical protein ACK56I_33090, partial [bacterium]
APRARDRERSGCQADGPGGRSLRCRSGRGVGAADGQSLHPRLPRRARRVGGAGERRRRRRHRRLAGHRRRFRGAGLGRQGGDLGEHAAVGLRRLRRSLLTDVRRVGRAPRLRRRRQGRLDRDGSG